ncbi:MAG: sigma-70 family RNA polymerase sigma factor [Verrucomicrobiaceae bacterium]|nr:sigma-70 family RNA polymerase sigma factor [Verrucomicrobiaceae bacterium]
MSQPDNSRFVPFPSTRWTLVRRVKNGGDAEAERAMNEICRQYWYPIYAFTRRHGFPTHDAQDITQTFFQRIVTSEAIHDAQEEKGQLRSFMLAMLKRIIANHVRHASTQKRGGSRFATLSFDDLDAEERYKHEPADLRDPETLFDRAWAAGILDAAEKKLQADFAKANNLEDYHQLREYLPLGDNATPYADVAEKIGISEGALRLQIHRMRKRYAKCIEEEILQTVSYPEEVKAELEHLMNVIGTGG